MSAIENFRRLCEAPSHSAVESPRLRGTPWAHSALARLFYRGIESTARQLSRGGITADSVTYASLVLAILAGLAVGLRHPGLAAGLVLASGSLDLLDGAVARATGSSSRWGALLDSTLDRVSDAAPLAGVIVYYSDGGWLVAAPLLSIVSGFVISYVRARSEALGLRLPSLFMRRAERLLLVAGSLALGTIPLGSAIAAPLLLAGIALTGLLNGLGALSILAAARTATRCDAC